MKGKVEEREKRIRREGNKGREGRKRIRRAIMKRKIMQEKEK
jgi:hypothetical protein